MSAVTDDLRPVAARWLTGIELLIEWNDGHSSAFMTDYLREQCPCAWCRVERKKDPRERDLLAMRPTAQALANPSVEPVGRYGIRINWGDGHSSGIYPFTYLRLICPCPDCSQAKRPG